VGGHTFAGASAIPLLWGWERAIVGSGVIVTNGRLGRAERNPRIRTGNRNSRYRMWQWGRDHSSRIHAPPAPGPRRITAFLSACPSGRGRAGRVYGRVFMRAAVGGTAELRDARAPVSRASRDRSFLSARWGTVVGEAVEVQQIGERE
jgi:hypothetical protein